MRLIFRADDVGYTPTHNQGTFKAVEEGIVTTLDMMLDCTGTVEALKFAKAHPWLSVGWHTHMWGSPVSDPKTVPSLVNAQGRFLGRHDRKGGTNERAGCKYEEAHREFTAQLALCREILGRLPLTTGIMFGGENDFGRALADTAKENGILTGFMTTIRGGQIHPAKPEYAGQNIVCVDPALQYEGAYTKDIQNFPQYTPMNFYNKYLDLEANRDNTLVTPWHPGYLDDLVFSESSMGAARVKDVQVLCSDEIKEFIIRNKIELVNFHDAIYGTHQYQQHLKDIGSPLYMGVCG